MFRHHRSAVSSQDESGVESEAQSLPELFSLICEDKEIQEGIQLRWGERSTLNGLNGNGKKNTENCQLRFQIPGKVSTNADKVNILLQAQVSGHYIGSVFWLLFLKTPAIYTMPQAFWNVFPQLHIPSSELAKLQVYAKIPEVFLKKIP